jgi:uridine kinase
MIPADCPTHLSAASLACFARVKKWIEREAASRSGPFLVGIGGPGGGGKSTLSRWLRHHVDGARILSLDDFRLPRDRRPSHGRYGSHPEGNDLGRLKKCLRDFHQGRPIRQPVFDPLKGAVLEEIRVPAATLLLADGEIAAHAEVRACLDRLILVEAHWRTQLNTRLTRDLKERHCSLEKAMDIFLQSNLRDYPRFSAGAHEAADVLLYCNARHTFSLRRLPPRT